MYRPPGYVHPYLAGAVGANRRAARQANERREREARNRAAQQARQRQLRNRAAQQARQRQARNIAERQARQAQEVINLQLARQLQANFNAAANQGVNIPQNVQRAVVAVGQQAANRAANGNNNERRRARQIGAEIGGEIAVKLVEAKRLLAAAARYAANGSVLLARKLGEKAARLSQEVMAIAPERQVIRDYAGRIFTYSQGLLRRLGGAGLLTYATNLLGRLRVRRTPPLAPARSVNNNTNINRQLNRIRVNRMATRNGNAVLLNRTNKNLILGLSDNVPEFFMIKKIIENINQTAQPESWKEQLLSRIPQYLRIMRYYKQIDAHVSRMPMPSLEDLKSWNTPAGRAEMPASINSIKAYAQSVIGTMIHYENIWQVLGESYGIYRHGYGRITEAKRAKESIDLIKSYSGKMNDQIHQSALAFRDVYNRVGERMVLPFVRKLAEANAGTPCIDAGTSALYEVSQEIQNNYPSNINRLVPNSNRWTGTQYSITTKNGELNNGGRLTLNSVLENHSSRLTNQVRLDRNLFWNSVKNKNLKINGNTKKISNIPSAKNWINNWHRREVRGGRAN